MAKKQKKELLSSNAFDNHIFGWYAPEFLRYERGRLWFFIAGFVDIGLIAYAFITSSFTMLLVFVILPIVFILHHREKPKQVDVLFSAYGVKFGILKIPYSHIKGFWIFHDPPYVDELHLQTSNNWHPEVTIPLMGVDPSILRQYLVTQIPECEGKKQSLLEIMVRFLRLT